MTTDPFQDIAEDKFTDQPKETPPPVQGGDPAYNKPPEPKAAIKAGGRSAFHCLFVPKFPKFRRRFRRNV